jgi:hypothetical protein
MTPDVASVSMTEFWLGLLILARMQVLRIRPAHRKDASCLHSVQWKEAIIMPQKRCPQLMEGLRYKAGQKAIFYGCKQRITRQCKVSYRIQAIAKI